MKTTEITLESIAQVLIRCFWIGVALQLVWVIWFFAVGQWAYELNHHLFGLTRHEFDLMMLCWMAAWKFCLIAALVPYLALRMMLRGKTANLSDGKLAK